MNITYASFCQICKANGKDSRLHRDLSAPETIFCTQGHKFSGPEIEDYLTAAPGEGTRVGNSPVAEEEFVPMPQVPAPAVEQLQRELQEAVERTSPFELSPPPSAPEPGKHGEATALSVLHHEEEAARKMADPRALASAKAPQAATAVAEPEPAVRPAPATPVDPHKPRKPVRQLPGGALEITVVIPDPHASYLQGEAEFRGKTVQDHFEEIMLAGMDSRWWY